MNTIRFGNLPVLIRIAAGLTLLNSWILFEEIVVDRTGLWRYMPLYRVGDACIWDAGAVLFIVTGLVAASRARSA